MALTRMRFRFRQTNQLLADPMEDLSRKVRIGYSTGEIEGSEQSAENKQGPSALIRAARWKQGAEESQAPLHPFGVEARADLLPRVMSPSNAPIGHPVPGASRCVSVR